MDAKTLKQTLEALLMASDRPLGVDELLRLVAPQDGEMDGEMGGKTDGKIRRGDVQKGLDALVGERGERGVELKEVASGYRYQTREEFSPSIGRLWKEKPPRYSRALLETLALIVYRQPITRAEIEEVRGVAVNTYMIRLLEEREWIKAVGHKEAPGRPALYATTKEFLDYFNLRSLDELPALIEMEEIARLHPELRLEPPGGEPGGAGEGAESGPARDAREGGGDEPRNELRNEPRNKLGDAAREKGGEEDQKEAGG